MRFDSQREFEAKLALVGLYLVLMFVLWLCGWFD
jgi:hypothetical protein